MHRLHLCVVVFVGLGGLAAGQAPTPLPALVAEALRNSPRIQAAELSWQAARLAVKPAGTLPDPKVELQQMSVGSPLPFAGYTNSNFAYIGIGASQSLPYPGKLRLQAAIAQSRADTLLAQRDQARRLLTAQVARAYIQLAYMDATLQLLGQQQTLLAQAERLAEVRYRANQGPQADVLSAQLQQTGLLRDLATWREQQQSAQALLRELLNRPPGAPAITPVALAETHLLQGDEQVLAALPAADPALAAQTARIAGAGHAVALAHKDFLPDFSVQYMYQHTAAPYRDYYMWTVGATLPIFHRASRQQPELEQALAGRAAAQAGYRDLEQQQRFAVTNALLIAHRDEQVLTIDQQALLPQARASLEAALTAYADGHEDLASFMAAWREQLAIGEQYWSTLAEHETALTSVEEITGVGHD